MSEVAIPLLVLGLGNLLCTDDGAGVRAVQLLGARYEPPPGVRVLDGGTLGLALLPHLELCERAILVDAVLACAPPGSLVRIAGDQVPLAAARRLSPHQIGVADLLAGASLTGRSPVELVLLGVVPESIELGFGLSPAVEASLPDLVQSVLDECARLGHPFTEARHVLGRTG
jgi:hydrogenase maturation protease